MKFIRHTGSILTV